MIIIRFTNAEKSIISTVKPLFWQACKRYSNRARITFWGLLKFLLFFHLRSTKCVRTGERVLLKDNVLMEVGGCKIADARPRGSGITYPKAEILKVKEKRLKK